MRGIVFTAKSGVRSRRPARAAAIKLDGPTYQQTAPGGDVAAGEDPLAADVRFFHRDEQPPRNRNPGLSMSAFSRIQHLRKVSDPCWEIAA